MYQKIIYLLQEIKYNNKRRSDNMILKYDENKNH